MSNEINIQPRLYAPDHIDPQANEIEHARILRLRSFQRRIAERPEVFQKAFTELGDDATSDRLDTKDEAAEIRSASRQPKTLIKEFFTKRDDLSLELDESSEKAIFDSQEFRELAQKSTEKLRIVKRTGVMGSRTEENPEALEASNAVRRYILGEYLGRAVLWRTQQDAKREQQAG